MKEFRKLMNPWDEPLLRNYRPIQQRSGRRLFFFKPHWCLYNSLLPIPVHPDPPITILSPVYMNHPHLLPKQNAYMLEPPEEVEEVNDGTDAHSSNKSQTSRLTWKHCVGCRFWTGNIIVFFLIWQPKWNVAMCHQCQTNSCLVCQQQNVIVSVIFGKCLRFYQ